MFNQVRRAVTRATKLSRAGKLIAATLVMRDAVAASVKPPRKKRAAVPKPRKATTAKARALPAPAKPRATLGETVRRISAGGMPAIAAKTATKAAVARGASFRLGSFSGESGKRSYKLYIPARPAGAAGQGALMPLVVMLHGCTQTPDDFATGTGMNRLADAQGFMVVYPAQPRGANNNRCWNWFKPADQGRDQGEPALIAGITRKILHDHPADPKRVYVAGLSAGGAAAAILAHAYPDLFAAAGVHSGVPIGAAGDATQAFLAMRAGSPGSRLGVAMPTIIFHGDADSVVHPRNGRALAARSLATFPRLKETVRPGRRADGRAFSQTTHSAASGKSFCEYWAVQDAGHAWSGGAAAGSFTDPAGPDASGEMLRFFLQHRLGQKV
ncbi:PHB depolymerase family esterase [Paracoccaceae bacterium Fryx2]|nr:PHB depolymerase family esterase [Paracoccaceae bacterium Fryx2]